MEKKGFTLIELLAVIVILAIIALIATPIIMNVIENTKKGSAERTASNYIDAVKTAVATERIKGNILEGEYLIDEDGNLCPAGETCTEANKIMIDMNGKKPNGVKIVLENGRVTTDSIITVNGYEVKYDKNGSLKAEKIVATEDEEEETDENATPAECFTYVENYDYTINKDKCVELIGADFEGWHNVENSGELMCSGNKIYDDLINFSGAVLGYSKDDLVNAGVISNVTANNTLSITGYTCGGESGTHKDVVVPKKIEGKTVTTIAMGAFSTLDLLTSEEIEEVKINSIVMPNSISTIESYAFYINTLTSVTMPSSLESMGEFVFTNNSLTNVTIPGSVTTMGESAFSANFLTNLTLSNGIKTIGNSAFVNNSLTSITIPSSVKTIGEDAFSSNSLTSVTIPGSVTTIFGGAFGHNELTSVTIENGVEIIGENAFTYNDLTRIEIPNSVTTIGYTAFSVNPLTSVEIKNTKGNVTLGHYAFGDFDVNKIEWTGN